MWSNVQYTLFPQLEKDLGPLSAKHKKLISVLELVRIEEYLPCTEYTLGRPPKDRPFIARAYIAKIVFNFPHTKQLIEYLKKDTQLKCICGWHSMSKLPSEAKFSRAFNEFSQTALPDCAHQALIKNIYKDRIIEHVVRDSTPIESREKPLKKESVKTRKKAKGIRQNKQRLGEPTSRQKQLMEKDLNKMIRDLPRQCDKGMKKSAQGYTMIWKGYKLHAAIDDHCIPLAAILTSASTNDCEVAIPLGAKSNLVAANLYDLMDAAYDHPEILQHSAALGHVPIVDKCPKNKIEKIEKETEKQRKKLLKIETVEDRRYKGRLPKERFNATYKDYYGGRSIFYRGYQKVACHIMFGVLVFAASSIIKLIC